MGIRVSCGIAEYMKTFTNCKVTFKAKLASNKGQSPHFQAGACCRAAGLGGPRGPWASSRAHLWPLRSSDTAGFALPVFLGLGLVDSSVFPSLPPPSSHTRRPFHPDTAASPWLFGFRYCLSQFSNFHRLPFQLAFQVCNFVGFCVLRVV